MDANQALLWWPEFFAQLVRSVIAPGPLSKKNAELKTVPPKES
jgi:hypothetical protein